ncbi:hypothetical protein COL26b_012252 [Colletotrichum chrysophilum]|nr:uncharacterized protein COL26b_012252 [Colletotrichum chrysophilum]KAJ0364990.1 hypothetical protein COL26b_012252 [Colletotrichum chrysophilum]
MLDNKLEMSKTRSHTQCKKSLEANATDVIELRSPAENQIRYVMDRATESNITAALNDAVTGDGVPTNHATTGSDRLLHAIAETELLYSSGQVNANAQNQQNAWLTAIEGMARNIEIGLLNFLLEEGGVFAEGTAWAKQTYIKVRWEWLTFLAVQICLSVVILVMVIWETATADVDIIKSSTLPALFAINSEELANIEHRFEEGEPLVEKGHQQVVPRGIGGQLYKTGGKWILRSR